MTMLRQARKKSESGLHHTRVRFFCAIAIPAFSPYVFLITQISRLTGTSYYLVQKV